MAQVVFKRYEKKYILNGSQYRAFIEKTSHRLVQDKYGKHTICNIYFDTDNYALVRKSIEKPAYKEKLRLRSYGIPSSASHVFVEIKKKFDGIVYKRRVEMTLEEAYRYIYKRETENDSQILNEIDYFLDFHKPDPKVYLAYDRIAMFDKENPCVRVTFDTNIRWRDAEIELENGAWGDTMLDNDTYIMEIKIPDAMPMWICDVLDELKIYPQSYSKYGTCYREHLLQGEHTKVNDKGEKSCA